MKDILIDFTITFFCVSAMIAIFVGYLFLGEWLIKTFGTWTLIFIIPFGLSLYITALMEAFN